MAACQTIIRRALRSLGILAAGEEPSGADAEDGLERLQSLVLGLPGLIHNGVWRERQVDVSTTPTYTACEGERITCTGAVAVTLPTTVPDFDGDTRPPHDLAKVAILGPATVTSAGLWIYSATKGGWGQLDKLAIDGDLPFGDEDDLGLAAQLAVDWSDEFGASATVTDRTMALAAQSAKSFRARFKKHEPQRHHHHDGWRDYTDFMVFY